MAKLEEVFSAKREITIGGKTITIYVKKETAESKQEHQTKSSAFGGEDHVSIDKES